MPDIDSVTLPNRHADSEVSGSGAAEVEAGL